MLIKTYLVIGLAYALLGRSGNPLSRLLLWPWYFMLIFIDVLDI
jgi:hypothetical protein